MGVGRFVCLDLIAVGVVGAVGAVAANSAVAVVVAVAAHRAVAAVAGAGDVVARHSSANMQPLKVNPRKIPKARWRKERWATR